MTQLQQVIGHQKPGMPLVNSNAIAGHQRGRLIRKHHGQIQLLPDFLDNLL